MSTDSVGTYFYSKFCIRFYNLVKSICAEDVEEEGLQPLSLLLDYVYSFIFTKSAFFKCNFLYEDEVGSW